MYKNYWRMPDKELERLARKYNLRGFLEETAVLTNDRKIGTDFAINRRDIIEQLLQRDNRNIAFWSAIVAVLGAAISLFANYHLFAASNQSVYQTAGEARFGMNGENLKLFVIETKNQLGKVFLFQYDDGSIAKSLFVENPNIESPSFKIVKGQGRDWLVVTTVENSGTGYLKRIDTWYIANSYYQGNPAILSYPSYSHSIGMTGMPMEKFTTDATVSADDKAIDVEFDFEACEAQDNCTKTTKVAHYVWNSEKELFILDEKKPE